MMILMTKRCSGQSKKFEDADLQELDKKLRQNPFQNFRINVTCIIFLNKILFK